MVCIEKERHIYVEIVFIYASGKTVHILTL